MASRYLIYVLTDPRNDQVRYVGKTEGRLQLRINHHMFRARRGERHHVYCWIRQLISHNLLPIVEVVEESSSYEELVQAECFYIAYLKSLGFKLTNHTDGGEGCLGYKHTDEARALMSAIKRGKKPNRIYEYKLTDEQIRQIVESYTQGGQRHGFV